MLRDLQIIIICFITGLQLLASALLCNCRPYSFQFLASLQCTRCEASDPVSRRSLLISAVVCKCRQCGVPTAPRVSFVEHTVHQSRGMLLQSQSSVENAQVSLMFHGDPASLNSLLEYFVFLFSPVCGHFF